MYAVVLDVVRKGIMVGASRIGLSTTMLQLRLLGRSVQRVTHHRKLLIHNEDLTMM